MVAAHHVPDELIEDIFSRVPAKSLVGFKSASQKWYSLLSEDYEFAKFHLKQRSKNHLRLVFFQLISLSPSFLSLNMDNNESSKFEFPVNVDLIGSANGLVCVAPSHKKCCFLWNPSTGETKKIYVPVSTPSHFLLGFGYDCRSDDFKIFADCNKGCFQIFSLKTNSWKIVESAYRLKNKAFHWNGALHWCLNEKIAAFDLAKEVFSYIELPDEMKRTGYTFSDWHSVLVTMWEYRGYLCISWTKDIWMMLKYGDSKSWIKLNQSLAGFRHKPLGMSTLGEIFYQVANASGFVKSDIQGRMLNDDESLLLCPFPPGHSYTESLISPKCFDAKKTIRRPRKQRKLINAT